MFTSDNGLQASSAARSHAIRGAGSTHGEGEAARSCANRLLEGAGQPRKSDGIVDLADLFPTALDLASHGAKVANLVPKTTFIDGVDDIFLHGNKWSVLTVDRALLPQR